MAYVETDNTSYYLHKFGSLLFGLIFFLSSLLTSLNDGTIEINGVPTKATFMNSLPSFIIGGAFIILFIWLCFSYYRVVLTDYNVQKQLFNRYKKYKWEDFEEIDEVVWLWRGNF